MAAAAAADMWTVVLIAKDAQQTQMYKLSADSTIEEVKRRWQETLGRPSPSIFRRIDRSRLRDHQQLTEVGEVSPGCRTVNVLVEEAIEVTVQLYKSQTEHAKPMTISASETPEGIHPQIRAMFGLDEDEHFRLRTHRAPLNYNLTFDKQDMDEGDVLLIDVGFKLEVRDEWSSSLETRLMFGSEAASELRSEDSRAQRLLLGGVPMELGSDLVDALPREYRRLPHIFVQRQQQRDITMMENAFLKQSLVWPTDLTGKLIDKCPPMPSALWFEKERLRTDATLKEAALPDHALVHTLTRVTVKGSDGKRRIVRLPDMATVVNLEAAVSGTEGTTRFFLKSGGRVLDRSDKLAKVLIDGRGVEVERHGDTVTVSLCDRSVRVRSDEAEMRFTQLMREVSGKAALKLKSLTERTLQCGGCGRRLTQAEEAFQAIPAQCCRVRSLQLIEWRPAVMRDAGTQGPCPNAGGRVRRKTAGRRRRTAGAAEQTEKRTAAATTQHPPPPPAPRPFVVFNDSGVGEESLLWIHSGWIVGHFSFTDLLLGDTPSARQVREAAAAHLSVSPAEVQLWREMWNCGGGGGVEMFEVFDYRRGFAFADAAGRWYREDEVDKEFKELRDDDPFPLVRGVRNVIYVLRR